MALHPDTKRVLTHPSVWVVFALLSVVWVAILVDVSDDSGLVPVVRVLAVPGYLVLIAVNVVNESTVRLASTSPVLYLAAVLAFYVVSVVLGVGVRGIARRLA